MVVLKNSALGLNFQFHDLAKNHTLFNGNVYPTKNFRHGLKNSALITQAKCNSNSKSDLPLAMVAFLFVREGKSNYIWPICEQPNCETAMNVNHFSNCQNGHVEFLICQTISQEAKNGVLPFNNSCQRSWIEVIDSQACD